MTRESQLLDAFVAVADTLVADYDVADLLYDLCRRVHDTLDVHAVGVLLAGDGLELAAASTEQMRELELFELQGKEGPCADAFAEGRQVLVPDLATGGARWGRFTARALEAGFHAVFAFPLRLRGDRIGAMNLLRDDVGMLTERDLTAAQGLADIATIGILQERAVADARDLSDQLQRALRNRVVIEQAKGVLATTQGVSVGEAFTTIRQYARSHNRRIVDVAREVVAGTSQFTGGENPR